MIFFSYHDHKKRLLSFMITALSSKEKNVRFHRERYAEVRCIFFLVASVRQSICDCRSVCLSVAKGVLNDMLRELPPPFSNTSPHATKKGCEDLKFFLPILSRLTKSRRVVGLKKLIGQPSN